MDNFIEDIKRHMKNKVAIPEPIWTATYTTPLDIAYPERCAKSCCQVELVRYNSVQQPTKVVHASCDSCDYLCEDKCRNHRSEAFAFFRLSTDTCDKYSEGAFPRFNDTYWYITDNFLVNITKNKNGGIDKFRKKTGNVFLSYDEALKERDNVNK